MEVLKGAAVTGDVELKGKLSGVSIVTKEGGDFAGTAVGIASIGSRLEAPAAQGFGIYTKPKGATVDEKAPRLFVNEDGNVGIATTKPTARLHITAEKTALRVEAGSTSFGEASVIEVDGLVSGKAAAGSRFTILANGNVGVNMPQPEEKLHVQGGLKVDSGAAMGPSKATLFVTNTLQKCDEHSIRVRDHFFVSGCGKVGVKTPKPLAEFHVTGKTKTDFLDVHKDVTIDGTLTATNFAPVKGAFSADKLKVLEDAQFIGRVQLDSDVVIKGNLYVEKEVKMTGGDTEEDEMSEMMESRLALIEESHKSLQESHQALQDKHSELLNSHSDLQQHNAALQARLQSLEERLA